MGYEYVVTLKTTKGDVKLSKTCLPMFGGKYVGDECTELHCSEPVYLIRCRASQIEEIAEKQMFLHPERVTLLYSSLTYFELVIGSDSAVFSWK